MPHWLIAFTLTAIAAITAPLASKMAVQSMHPLSAATVEAAMTLVSVMVIAALISRVPLSLPAADNMGWALLAGGLWSFYVIGVYSRLLNNPLRTQAFRLVRNRGALLKACAHTSKRGNDDCGPA